MSPTSSRIGSILLVGAVVLGAAGCGKGSKAPAKGKTEVKTGKDKDQPSAGGGPALSAKKLPTLPLQVDAADTWKIEEDKVAPEGGATLSTLTGEVSIVKDGVGGVKKMTLDDEKKLMTSDSPPPQEVNEQQLADGWALSYKIPGVLPYHATVYRNIGAGTYRCVVITEEAAEMADGITVCKSLRP